MNSGTETSSCYSKSSLKVSIVFINIRKEINTTQHNPYGENSQEWEGWGGGEPGRSQRKRSKNEVNVIFRLQRTKYLKYCSFQRAHHYLKPHTPTHTRCRHDMCAATCTENLIHRSHVQFKDQVTFQMCTHNATHVENK